MSRRERLLLHVLLAALAASGAALFVSKYLLPHDDPFSVTGSAWEPWAHAAHVLLAPLYVFAFGHTVASHVLSRLGDAGGPRRRTGILLMVLVIAAIASGYVLQVATGAALRPATAIVHIVASALLVLAYLAHLLRPRPGDAPGRRRSAASRRPVRPGAVRSPDRLRP